MKRALVVASLVTFNLSCTSSGNPWLKITQCLPTKSMVPRITEECESSLINETAYYRRLSESLLSRNVYPRRLGLIFTYKDDRTVDSICILNSTEVNLDSRLSGTIRSMSKIRPPKTLSCLSIHHAQIHFSWSIQMKGHET
jgi:hypothetical protein